jgi:hypothetical protein
MQLLLPDGQMMGRIEEHDTAVLVCTYCALKVLVVVSFAMMLVVCFIVVRHCSQRYVVVVVVFVLFCGVFVLW